MTKDNHAFLRSVLSQGPTMVSCGMVRPLLDAYDKLEAQMKAAYDRGYSDGSWDAAKYSGDDE